MTAVVELWAKYFHPHLSNNKGLGRIEIEYWADKFVHKIYNQEGSVDELIQKGCDYEKFIKDYTLTYPTQGIQKAIRHQSMFLEPVDFKFKDEDEGGYSKELKNLYQYLENEPDLVKRIKALGPVELQSFYVYLEFGEIMSAFDEQYNINKGIKPENIVKLVDKAISIATGEQNQSKDDKSEADNAKEDKVKEDKSKIDFFKSPFTVHKDCKHEFIDFSTFHKALLKESDKTEIFPIAYNKDGHIISIVLVKHANNQYEAFVGNGLSTSDKQKKDITEKINTVLEGKNVKIEFYDYGLQSAQERKGNRNMCGAFAVIFAKEVQDDVELNLVQPLDNSINSKQESSQKILNSESYISQSQNFIESSLYYRLQAFISNLNTNTLDTTTNGSLYTEEPLININEGLTVYRDPKTNQPVIRQKINEIDMSKGVTVQKNTKTNTVKIYQNTNY
jgi:hypothetical protein